MSDTHPSPPAPAGWYPEGVNGVRYWNGSEWTDHRAPAAQAIAARPRNPSATSAIVFMAITIACALSFVGVVFAWLPAIIGLSMGVAGYRESARLSGAGKTRSVWAIVICGGGLALGVIAGIYSIVNP